MSLLLYRLGRFSHRSRRLVASIWVAVLLVLGVAAAMLSEPAATSFSLPGTESQRAFDLLEARFPETPLDGATARLVFIAEEGSVTDPGFRRDVRAVLAEVAAIDHVAQVADPYDAGMVSEDGTTALAEAGYDVPFADIDADDRDRLLELLEDAESGSMRIEAGGDALEPQPEVGAELTGLLVAGAVLLLTFGSLVAAGMPLATGITGVTTGVLGISTASGFVDLGSTTPILALMLGLAVGIDYALFIVSRYRHELLSGRAPDDAAGRAIGTAGSAVVFAGLTVMIALAGLSVVGIGLYTAMGVAAAGTVLMTVLVALTLLPALLGFAGRRILPRRQRAAYDEEIGPQAVAIGVERRTLGRRWVEGVTSHPVTVLATAVVALGVATLPVLDLRLGLPDQGTYPERTTQRQAYDAIGDAFGPGVNGPLLVVVDATAADDPDGAAAAVRTTAARTPGVAEVTPAQFNEAGDTAILGVVPSSGPNSDATERVVTRLREDVDAVAHRSGAALSVTGNTALLIDFSDKTGDALLTYVLVVVGLSFLLLMAVFRSIVVPLKAALGFLLTVGVTYGALIAVFQWGWLEWLGINPTATVSSALPLLLVGMVFGLAMDYEVFLVTRMREEHVHGAAPVAAVQVGFQHGARVVAAAALIMISVFSGFVLGDAADITQLGVALAVAVAVDAFVVRMTIVPAVLALAGTHAWWLPGWLDRLLPDLDVEGERLHQVLDREGSPAGPRR